MQLFFLKPVSVTFVLLLLWCCLLSSSSTSAAIMPFMDLHKHFGLELDRPLSNQSTKQPYSVAPRCYAFEKEWIECSHGIGRTRARKECQIEYEDFMECMHRRKTVSVSVSAVVCCRIFSRTFFSRFLSSAPVLAVHPAQNNLGTEREVDSGGKVHATDLSHGRKRCQALRLFCSR